MHAKFAFKILQVMRDGGLGKEEGEGRGGRRACCKLFGYLCSKSKLCTQHVVAHKMRFNKHVAKHSTACQVTAQRL